MSVNILTLLLVAILGANLPFTTERIMGIKKVKHKAFAWRLVELVVLYALIGGFARYLEAREMPVHSQRWPFYVTTAALFVVFAFPGFVMRYFWRRHPEAPAATGQNTPAA